MSDNTASDTPVVYCQDVQRIYQQESVPVYALRGANLTITAGEFVILAGPPRPRKYTLINLFVSPARV